MLTNEHTDVRKINANLRNGTLHLLEVEVDLQGCRRDEGNNYQYTEVLFYLSFELIMLDYSTTVTVIIGYELIVKSTETYVSG